MRVDTAKRDVPGGCAQDARSRREADDAQRNVISIGSKVTQSAVRASAADSATELQIIKALNGAVRGFQDHDGLFGTPGA